MAVSACGASVGGSARESNTAPTKGTLRAAGCRHKRVDAMLGTNVSECGQFGQGADRIVEIWGTKPGEFHTDACRIGEDCTIDLCDSSRLSVVSRYRAESTDPTGTDGFEPESQGGCLDERPGGSGRIEGRWALCWLVRHFANALRRALRTLMSISAPTTVARAFASRTSA